MGGGPEKVRAVGPGLERGQANTPCMFENNSKIVKITIKMYNHIFKFDDCFIH